MPEMIDPKRSSELKLAVRSAWILGLLSAGFGIQLFFRFGLHALSQWQKPLEALAIFGWIIPGLIIVMSAIYLNRNETWAGTMAKITTACQILIALSFFFAQFTLTPITPVPVVMTGLWAAALVQFFWHLGLAGRAIRMIRTEQWRGFDVMDTPADSAPKPVITDKSSSR